MCNRYIVHDVHTRAEMNTTLPEYSLRLLDTQVPNQYPGD